MKTFICFDLYNTLASYVSDEVEWVSDNVRKRFLSLISHHDWCILSSANLGDDFCESFLRSIPKGCLSKESLRKKVFSSNGMSKGEVLKRVLKSYDVEKVIVFDDIQSNLQDIRKSLEKEYTLELHTAL